MRSPKSETKFSFVYFFILLSILLLLQSMLWRRSNEISYARFKELAAQPYRIQECIISTDHIRGEYIKDEEYWKKIVSQRRKLLFEADVELTKELDENKIPSALREKFNQNEVVFSDTANVETKEKNQQWRILDKGKKYLVIRGTSKLQVYEEKKPQAKQEQKKNSWLSKDRKIVSFTTVRVHDDSQLIALLEKHDVPYKGEIESNWGMLFLTWGLPLIIFVAFLIFLMRRMNNYGRDVMSFGKSKAKITAEEDTKTIFNDVAGCDEAKEELKEIVEFLKAPKKFEELGGKIPKGALLVGPPGTGKTLLAKAVAGEAGVPFFSISGSEFVEMFVGVGASRVRDLFQQAKAKHPCIIFIDEIDAVGRHRGAGLGGGHDEREQTLNQLLAEMDGFEPNKGIIMLAATNRPDVLDPALLRPGRFDRRIVIDHPDIKGREEILKIHAKGKPLAEDVDLKRLAQRTPGFSGADLANIMNEAALLAARKGQKQIEQENIAEAVERVAFGPERRTRIIPDKEKKIIAYHEGGHAIVQALHPYTDNVVHKITIIPRGRALGYVLSMPDQEKFNMTKNEFLAQICMALGGRVAEELKFKHVSTGAQNDLQQITNMARSMVARYGMSERLGPIAYDKEEGPVFLGREAGESRSYFGGQTMNQIDQEVKKIIWNCYETTARILHENREILDIIAGILLEKESLEGQDFMKILKKLRKGEKIEDIDAFLEQERQKEREKLEQEEREKEEKEEQKEEQQELSAEPSSKKKEPSSKKKKQDPSSRSQEEDDS